LLLLLLLLLGFTSFPFLLSCGMSLRHLFRRGLFGPTPFLFELFIHEADAPASLLVDLFEDPEDFFLLTAVGEYLACVCERADGDRSDAAVFNVSKLC
jgi:hypothetical protein